MRPAWGPPNSLSPENVTIAAPAAIRSRTIGSRGIPYPVSSIKAPAPKEDMRKPNAAARRLPPYVGEKKNRALGLRDAGRTRREPHGLPRDRSEQLEPTRQLLLALHDGQPKELKPSGRADDALRGYVRLGPPELGWAQSQVHAYLAGIMDSDGSFRIERRRVRDMLHPHYRLNLRCAQVAPSRAIDLLAETFGGNVGFRVDGRPNTRRLATWSLHDKSAVPALKSLLPHLVVKKTEARFLLELRRLKEEGKKGTTEWVHSNRWHDRVTMRKRCYTDDQVIAFERIHRAVQCLHSGTTLDLGPRPPDPKEAARPEI